MYLRSRKFWPWSRLHRPYGRKVLWEAGLLTVCVLVTLPWATAAKD